MMKNDRPPPEQEQRYLFANHGSAEARIRELEDDIIRRGQDRIRRDREADVLRDRVRELEEKIRSVYFTLHPDLAYSDPIQALGAILRHHPTKKKTTMDYKEAAEHWQNTAHIHYEAALKAEARVAELEKALGSAISTLEDVEEPAWSGFGGSETVESLRRALAGRREEET